ncbi:MAG: peroxidase, partial [Herbiconiux sp.]|nr:peroxidase [Herbiconiux sp.]
MSLFGALRAHIQPHTVSLELDDIQATVLRLRPEPYFGSHLLLRFGDADAGRHLIRSLAPRIASASEWWNGAHPWVSFAISYAGLEALELPQATLDSFPERFRVGMAARSAQLFDVGPNDPEHWERLFVEGGVHAAVTVLAASEEAWRESLAFVEEQVQEQVQQR